MKREWSAEELVEHWTVLPSEETEVQTKRSAARLGFVVLLKCFQYEGRFPDRPQDIPPVVVAHLAQQVGVAADQWEAYDCHGRTIKAHRAEIRSRLGFREPTVVDGEALVAWLCAYVLPTTPPGEHVLLAAYAHLRDLRIEPPTGVMKIGSRCQFDLILFLFRFALRGKERAARGLHGVPQLFATPREDRFRRHALQRLSDDFRAGVGDERP